jgi:YD repeat-containing protein
LWKVTNPLSEVTEYTYDSSHRMLTIKDARGIIYLTNQYDGNGRVTLQTQADSTTYQFAYTLDVNGKVMQGMSLIRKEMFVARHSTIRVIYSVKFSRLERRSSRHTRTHEILGLTCH